MTFSPSTTGDAGMSLRAYNFDWERECNHTILLPAMRTETLRVRRRCPDCHQTIEIRMWQPTSGGWHLVMREIHAAGRSWRWILDGKRWSTAL